MGRNRTITDPLEVVAHPVQGAHELEGTRGGPAVVLEPDGSMCREAELALQSIRTDQRSRPDVLADDGLCGANIFDGPNSEGHARLLKHMDRYFLLSTVATR